MQRDSIGLVTGSWTTIPMFWSAMEILRKEFLPRPDRMRATSIWANSSFFMPTTTSPSKAARSCTFTEDRMARFAALGWHVQRVERSNDVEAVALALENAREETGRPSLIAVRTHIGFGSPHKQDTAAAHGEALGVEEVRLTKEGMGWPVEPAFPCSRGGFGTFSESGCARRVRPV